MKRLQLHVPEYSELSYRQKIMSDPETMSYNKGYDLGFDGYDSETGCIAFPEEDWQDWYDYFVGQEPERFYAYICRTEDREFIGEVNLHKACDEYYDMGILIEAKHRGQGCSKEALKLLLKYAFETMKAGAVHNEFEDERDAAFKLHLDCGFKEVSRDGDLIQLLITADDYNRITIEDVPFEEVNSFWEKHIRYLTEDGIIDADDEEDVEYYSGEEYRGILEDHMLRETDRHHMVYFVRNREQVGAASYCTYTSEDCKCFLMDFWVFPEFRGNGMGHRCFKAFEERTRAEGAKYYEINSTKEDSVRFWKSLGFVENGKDEYDMPLFIKR